MYFFIFTVVRSAVLTVLTRFFTDRQNLRLGLGRDRPGLVPVQRPDASEVHRRNPPNGSESRRIDHRLRLRRRVRLEVGSTDDEVNPDPKRSDDKDPKKLPVVKVSTIKDPQNCLL